MRTLARVDILVRRLRLLYWLSHGILIIVLLVGLIALFTTNAGAVWLGLFFLLLPFGLTLDLFNLFLKQEIKRETLRANPELTYAVALILERSKQRAKYLWYYLLRDPSVTFVLARLGVTRDRIEAALPTMPEPKTWVDTASQYAKSLQQPLKPQHLFEVLQESESLAALWREMGISTQERSDVWQWYDRVEAERARTVSDFITKLKFAGGIGRDWTSGYTRALELYAFDLTEELQRAGSQISLVGHTQERQQILEYLSRDHVHNVLVTGEEGIGKTRLIYALASDFNAGNVPLSLRYKHMYMLDTGKVTSGAAQNEVEQRLNSILNEAGEVGNVVLVIPDFHLLVGAGGSDKLGVLDASALLTKYLQSPALQIIGVTTPEAFLTYVKPNASLEPHVLPVEVHEIGPQEAMAILETEVFKYEAKSRHLFTYQALVKVIEVAERHVHDKPYPEKALQLLDEVAGAVVDEPQILIAGRDVERILGQKLKVPTGAVTGNERDVLNNLEQAIRSRVIGQSEAVKAVANALRRARAGLHSGKRPIGSFLFLGPTGVGKTEMAKTIAALYYKNDKAFIRLDMSEYQTPDSIEKIIGGNGRPGTLTTAITDQPFSVVLLDEIEKADQSVRNLFLQILDDGHVTDGTGHRVDFTNAMVIATSNAGAQLIRETVQQGQVDVSFKQKLLDFLQSQGTFTPEWLNRFDAVVVFTPLSREEIRQVAALQVQELVQRLKTHNIDLTITDDVYDVLIEKGYDPQFGARPMRRAVQDVIESALAKSLINDSSEGMKAITLTKEMLA